MSIAHGKGDKGLATRLHSRVVRFRHRRCLACGVVPGDWQDLDAAHIVGRSWAFTRTWSPNLLALCRACHSQFDQDKTFTVKVLRALTRSAGALDEYTDRLIARKLLSTRDGQRIDWAVERLIIEHEAYLLDPEWAEGEPTLRRSTLAAIKDKGHAEQLRFVERERYEYLFWEPGREAGGLL